MIHTYRKDLKTKAQKLRREMTKEERHLWYDFLKGYPHQFKRQKPIGEYILDFYCASARLAVELDGGAHYKNHGITYDKVRDSYIARRGILVIRFSNSDINVNFAGVCASINNTVELRLQS